MTTEYPPYVCKLDAATQKKALDELYEDPKNRQGAIDTFRQWILQQKHMKCPMDDVFLLGFLRAKHFSQLEARQSLEFFMEFRDKIGGWMKTIDSGSARIDDVIDTSCIMWLGRDTENRQVLLIILGALDNGNEKLLQASYSVFATILYHMYLTDEMTQVHGTVFIGDFSKQTMANDMKQPLKDKQKATTMMQKTFPARVKAMYMVNVGNLFEFFFKLITSLLNDKLKQRLHCYTHGLEKLYKDIPMEILPREYLPDDYTGPCIGTINQVKDKMKESLHSAEIRDRIKYLTSDEFYIDMKDKEEDVPAASFRKLNVD